MVRQGQGQAQDLGMDYSKLDDPSMSDPSAGQSKGISRETAQPGSRYVDGYEPESEFAVSRRSQQGMINELSIRLSEPRDHSGHALSSGESMMVETLRKGRGRPPDRDRLEELAIPCNRASTCAAWRCPPPDPLAPPPGTGPDFTSPISRNNPQAMAKRPQVMNKHLNSARLDDLLSRLANPRQRPTMGGNMATGERIVMESQTALKSKTGGRVDNRDLIARLSTPRVIDWTVAPPSGEAVMFDSLKRTPRRAPNTDHLARLARPNRRGGSALNWRVGLPGSDEAGYPDDRTGTPVSMRTTSPPPPEQDPPTAPERSSMKLVVGTEDYDSRPTTSSSSMGLKPKSRTSQGLGKDKSSPKAPGSDSQGFKIYVGSADS